MFSELFESVARPNGKRKRWAVAISVTLQSACLLILIIVPLIYTEALPGAIFETTWVGPPEPAPPAVAQAPLPKAGVRAPRLLNHGILIEPPRIPSRVGVFEERPLAPETPLVEGPVSPGSGMDLLNFAPNSAETVSRPPVPSVPQRVPVTSTIEAAKLISQARPIYPPLAIQARIQGNVLLHAVISRDGRVSELQALSGHPLLVSTALEAVRQWRYSPTLLNGQAVEVETTITVSFVLGQ
jgi:periplasmic protein TonB